MNPQGLLVLQFRVEFFVLESNSQGGVASVSANSKSASFQLPLTFSNSCKTAVATHNGGLAHPAGVITSNADVTVEYASVYQYSRTCFVVAFGF